MAKRYQVLKMIELPFAANAFDKLAGIADIVTKKPSSDTLLKAIETVDAYYCSMEVQVTKDIIDRAKKLKVIATPSTGTDHIDVAYAESKGIKVLCLKNDIEFLREVSSTAELAWGLLLGVLRKIPSGYQSVKDGVWGRDRFRGHQLRGKTLGILGYGRLGTMVADYGKSFAMRVIACDIKPIVAEGITQVDFHTLLSESDILSIHIHLTEKTRKLINQDAFAKMRDGIVLINTSRGAIIDETAFLEALESGRVSAAGIDIIDGEWNPDLFSHPLIAYARSHDNLLITPHVGGVTYEAQTMAYTKTADKLYEYLAAL
jgi:D-3-phosphoglycerate dehydrogenase